MYETLGETLGDFLGNLETSLMEPGQFESELQSIQAISRIYKNFSGSEFEGFRVSFAQGYAAARDHIRDEHERDRQEFDERFPEL